MNPLAPVLPKPCDPWTPVGPVNPVAPFPPVWPVSPWGPFRLVIELQRGPLVNATVVYCPDADIDTFDSVKDWERFDHVLPKLVEV